MDQLKLYKYATWTLLILNIGIVSFFLVTKPKHPPLPPSPSGSDFQSEIIQTLNLDAQQAATFESLAEEHHQQMKSINQQYQELLSSYFKQLTNDDKAVNKEALLQKIQQAEQEKIETTYQHFEAIKEILSDEQLAQFEGVMVEFVDKILPGKKKNPPPPKDLR